MRFHLERLEDEQLVSRRPERATGPTDRSTAIRQLVRVLDEAGFVSEASAENNDEHPVVLHRHCSFLELAQAHQDGVCSLRLGLLDGILECSNTSVVVERLVPVASPDGGEAYFATNHPRSGSR